MAPLSKFGLSVSLLLSMANAYSRTIQRSELQEFAKNFSCSHPNLQYQFNNLTTLWDENERAAKKGKGNRSFITDAAGVGGNGDWLYRGVTNRQFNESQILGLIFNDSTSVSESRWFSTDMFTHAKIKDGDDFVTQRANYRNLPYDQRWSAFKVAFDKTAKQIDDLTGSKDSFLSKFDEHVRVGSSFNSTPQAIQFLTPTISYAEGYGEFVLHIKEVVKRGLDVERYNYNNPNWSYRIGSIYSMDRDEYMVPSHIPAWDVQIIKVRNGTGWHRTNYGNPIYYYTKIFEANNPCNVIGVRVDKPDSTYADARRVPVGMLLKCPDSKKCASTWDNAVGEQERLKAVVESTKIEDRHIFYVPYKVYQSDNPTFLRSQELSTIESLYSNIKPAVLNDVSFWDEVILKNYQSNMVAALSLAKKNPTIAQIKVKWTKDFQALLGSAKFKPTADKLKEVIDLANYLGLSGDKALRNIIMQLINNPADRLTVYNVVNAYAGEAVYHELLKDITNKMLDFKDLAPSMEITLHQRDTKALDEALIQATAKGLSQETGFASEYWDLIEGTTAFKLSLLEKALTYNHNNRKQYPLADSLELFNQLDVSLKTVPGRENILGLCIDYALGDDKLAAFRLAEKMATMELPIDREVDTLRSLWGYAKNEKVIFGADRPAAERTNEVKFVASTIRMTLFNNMISRLKALDAQDGGDRVLRHTKAFNQFFWEFISPPAPFLSFNALNSFSKITGNRDLITIWPDQGKDKVSVTMPTGDSYEVNRIQYETILKQSMSSYYLNQLNNEYEYEKDPKRQAAVYNTILKVVRGYMSYFGTGFKTDFADPGFKVGMTEMFTWNKFEDVAGLIVLMANLTDDSGQKKDLMATAKNVEKALTGMKAELPAVHLNPNDPKKLSDFWLKVKGDL